MMENLVNVETIIEVVNELEDAGVVVDRITLRDKLKDKEISEQAYVEMDETDHLRNRVKELEHTIAYKDGYIDGLKFSARCNGVSGGEVR